MSFGSSSQPKRFGADKTKKASKDWVCGCGVTRSRHQLFCGRCEKGQS